MKWLSSRRRETSDSEAPSAAVVDPGDAPIGPSSISTLADSPSASPTAPQAPASGEGGPATQSVPLDGAASDLPPGDEPQPEAPRDATVGPAGGVPLADALEKLREDLLRKQQELNDEQRGLNELFSTRLRSDEAQSRAVEKLHDELRQYKASFVRQQLLPVLKEVIFCHDFVSAQIERLASEPAGQPECRTLEATRQMLIDLLFKYDVEPYRSEGEPFDPRAQQCTHTIPSDRPEADKSVAHRGLPGFRGPEGIVRREQVSVYKFTSGAD